MTGRIRRYSVSGHRRGGRFQPSRRWFYALTALSLGCAVILCAMGAPVQASVLGPGAQPRGHVEVTVSISDGGAVGVLWEAERPGGIRPRPPASDPLAQLQVELAGAGYDAALTRPAATGRDVDVLTARIGHAAASDNEGTGYAGAIPGALAQEDSMVTWQARSYLVATLHRVEVRIRPGEKLLAALAPPGSVAAVPTFALFLQLPGRVFRSGAEARSVDGLYWSWDPLSSRFIDAQAESIELHPVPAGLAVLGVLIAVGSGALIHSEARRGRRAKHRRRRRGRGRQSQDPALVPSAANRN